LTENYPVTCLLDRSWNPAIRAFEGEEHEGTLLEFTVQSADDDPGTLVPAGIVLLNDNTFQSVPVEFITKI